MPPPRGAGRKGTCPYLNLPVFAESDSHSLDAPYLARQRCRGKLSSTSTYGTGAPLLSGERAEGAQRADCGEHTGGLPRFGPRWTRKTLLLLSLYSVGELGSLEN